MDVQLETDTLSTQDAVHVELGREALDWARERALREGTSLSEVFSEALRQLRITEARQRWLADQATTASPEEIAAVVAQWVREDQASAA